MTDINDLRSGAYTKIIYEHGFSAAMLGLSLSFHPATEETFKEPSKCFLSSEGDAKLQKMYKVATTLAHKQGGHNKFLESIQVWLLVRGSLSFWKQFDTYRAGITKQSESTMHTLQKRELTLDDFTREVHEVPKIGSELSIDEARDLLPSGFLETRIVCTNYKALQNIIKQRQGHRSKKWKVFIDSVLDQILWPEFLVEGGRNGKISTN